MLDSVYIKAKRKRNLIKQKVDEIEYPVVDASQQWVDYPIEENGLKGNIAAGDGSINKIRFLPFIFYAIDAEGIVHTHDGLKGLKAQKSTLYLTTNMLKTV